MNDFAKLLRRTSLLLIVTGIWAFVYYAVDPTFNHSILESTLILVPAFLLVIGLLPKMYLQSILDKITRKSHRASKKGIVIVSIATPVFFLAIYMLASYETFSLLQVSILEYIREPLKWDLILYGVGGGIQIIFLIVNLATLFQKYDQQDQVID